MTNKPEIIITPPKPNIKGVKPQTAQKIQQLLQNGRRYFGSSGASLTWQAYSPDYDNTENLDRTLVRIGLEAERETTQTLKKWIQDKPNTILIDSIHVRGYGKEEIDPETGMIEGGDTDHILLIGDEIILIDTKRWRNKRNYSISDNKQVLRTNKPFPGGNVKIMQATRLWLDYLDDDAKLTAIIYINNEETTVFRNHNWFKCPYKLVEPDRFIDLLNDKYNKYTKDWDKEHINTTLASQIIVNAVKPYDPRTRTMNQKSLNNFK